jgi:uncharacterized protein
MIAKDHPEVQTACDLIAPVRGINYHCRMPDNGAFDNDDIIDIRPPRRRRWLPYVVGGAIVGLLLFGRGLLELYIDALWFSSLGYAEIYWYKFRLGGLLFLVFLTLTFLMVRLPFVLLNRVLPQLLERPRVRLSSVEDLREVNFLPLIYRPGVWILATAVALMSAVSMSSAWPEFAKYLNAVDGGVTDPIFNRDVSFYLFKLPVLDLISGWLVTITLILFAVATGVSLYVWYVEKAQGFGGAETRSRATAAVSAAGALLALVLAANPYLARFGLLQSRTDLFAGVSYTDANVRLPALYVLAIALIIAAVLLALNAAVFKKPKLIGWVAGGVLAVWLFGLVIIPQAIYSFSVKPNEKVKEGPFIQHNIDMTRRAFSLDRFEEKQFQPALTLTSPQLRANQATLDNIRLWDPEVLQSTVSQTQEILTYYDFGVPDIDRYLVNGKLRQVMVAAREINVDQLPEKNWINQHLVYTHGYGIAMSTVNEFTAEGLPHLVVRDMPVKSDVPEIKITRPEIYFGEVTNSHVYVHTKPQGATKPEFNYPAEEQADSYSEYESSAGIAVGGLFRKTALAFYLGDGTTMLFSDYITSESRVLMRRNVLNRVRQIAPFLLFESDPYIVIGRDGRLSWMIDAFTHSDRYPYSKTYSLGGLNLNYIRNSVKVVIDAYEGDVKFYVFDPDDPIIKTYWGMFPTMFHPSSEMPDDLRQHIRYPDLLVAVQAQAYTLYHMQNPQTFYGREDQWAIATGEPAQPGTDPPPMEPYYVLMQLPGEQQVEFVNILPFTPTGPGRNNMIGWLATRNDGDRYGQVVVFAFPKSLTVNGPAQIRARVSQDAQLSALVTLWSQKGSEVVRGKLLVIPIADSLLFVESFYLQAAGSTGKLPELRQVAVATQDRLATGKTFEEALNLLFPELAGTRAPSPPSEVQPVQQPTPGQPSSSQKPAQPSSDEGERLAKQAQQLLTDYERLTAEGKHREAGEKLDQLKQTLTELNRRRGGG